jgi:hypothetical protein
MFPDPIPLLTATLLVPFLFPAVARLLAAASAR